MNDVTVPTRDNYGLLGLRKGASGEEIDAAYRELIEEDGYRTDVPLKQQWQRAREIKAAYAILSDPVERRAYDESLSGKQAGSLAAPLIGGAAAEAIQFRATDDQPPAHVTAPKRDALFRSGASWGPAGDALRPPRHVVIQDDEPAVSADQVSPGEEPVRGGQLLDGSRFSSREWASAGALLFALGTVTLLLADLSPGSDPRSPPSRVTPSGTAAADGPRADRGQDALIPTSAAPASSVPADELTASVQPDADAPSLGRRLAHERPTGTAGVTGSPASPPQVGIEQAPATAPSPDPLAPQAGADRSAAATAAASAGARAGPAATPVAAANAARTFTPLAPRPGPLPVAVKPRYLGGGPTDADNRGGRRRGTVGVQFSIAPTGAVSGCVTSRASGDAALDALTCRIVEQRVRFTPARDAQGRPVWTQSSATYVWGRGRRQRN